MTVEPLEINHPDDKIIADFALAMKAKMDFARKKYGDGWRDIPQTELWDILKHHVEKGDPVDVANFAMFIWYMKDKTGFKWNL